MRPNAPMNGCSPAPSRSEIPHVSGRHRSASAYRGGRWLANLLAAATLLLIGAPVFGAEVIPPAPRQHFNDYAGLVRPEVAHQLDRELEQFERDTSNQIVVAIYPRMQSDSSVDDYAVRVAQSWRVGQKERRNGAVLFVFAAERQIYIAVGYGLEGALPDALCKRIIEDEIVPQFRANDFTGGVTAGVRAILAATRGEYRGTSRTASDRVSADRGTSIPLILLFVFFLIMVLRTRSRRSMLYQGRGRRTIWTGGSPWGGSGGGFGGGSSGGGFSGGGGSFGGGGAGGRW